MPESKLDNLCPAPRGPRVTLVMGVVNLTPDSFSDGGRYTNVDTAVAGALQLLEDGADLLDLGGESSRPGAAPVSLEEESERVLPVLRRLRRETAAPISIDTTKAELARAALDEGATIINDISALRRDPAMARVIADADAWVVLMHMQGTPATMQRSPEYGDVAAEVAAFLGERARAAEDAGIAAGKIILDPGIGFGKTLQHNLALLHDDTLRALGRPWLIGCSRKSMIGALTGVDDPARRAAGSLAAAAAAVSRGAAIVRAHDVRETVEFFSVFDAIRGAAEACRA